MKISCKLRAIRKEKKLTQEDLASKLGISRQSIISVELGKCIPSLSLALEIAELFDTAIEEIFEIGEKINKLNSSSLEEAEESAPVSKDIKCLSGVAGREVKMTRDLLPFRQFGMGRFFDDDFQDIELPKSLAVSAPAINVYEKGKNVIVECQLPGIDPENVKIDVADDLVKISGEKKEEIEEKDKNYYRKEISYGSFARSVALPKKVKSSSAEADYNDGVLKITLPKIEEKESKTVKIKVKKKK
jgi:HSP20 family protein